MEAETNPRTAELRFGKYHLIATLGRGGMADVFLAASQGPAGFSKLQVIKRLRMAELGEESDAVTMFLDEARLAARLNHPNVVQTNEVGESDGEYFIAMEYLDGQPLNRVMHRVRLTSRGGAGRGEAVLLRIVADALSGLHYAHELTDYDGTPLNVVHRDASPHNIFVTYDGQTKVVDFGIAKASTRSSQTSTGVLKGKLAYMAPEQARCKPVDRRADIFIIGIVLWEVVAGRKMWKGLADMEIINKVFAQEIPRLEEVRPDAHPELLRICARALAYDPDDRYATAAELRADLLAYLDRSGHRVTGDDVSATVTGLFDDKRTQLQAVIDGQLKRLRTVGGAPLLDVNSYMPPPSTRSSPSTSSQQPLPNISYPSGEESNLTQQPPHPMPPPPSQGRRLLFAAVLGAVAAGVVGLVLMRGRGAEPAATVTPIEPPAAAVLAAPAPAAQAGAHPGMEQAAVPRTIELRISAEPPSAKLFLDDVPLETNPFTGKFPADGARHLIRVEAAGHATQKEFARFEEDLTLEFDLAKKTAAVQYRPHRTQSAAEPTDPASDPSAALSADPQPAAGTAGKPKRTLSGSDPWSGGQTAGAPATDTTGKPKRTLSGNDPWAK